MGIVIYHIHTEYEIDKLKVHSQFQYLIDGVQIELIALPQEDEGSKNISHSEESYSVSS